VVYGASKKKFFTPKDYLVREERAESKSEYLDGEIFAMAGGSFNHNKVVGNTFKLPGRELEQKPCQVLMSDMRLHVKPNGLYTYPDVMVVCGKVQYDAITIASENSRYINRSPHCASTCSWIRSEFTLHFYA
jgi:Uma2 family endonuclease